MKVIIAAIGKEKSGSVKDICDSYMKRIPWAIELKEFSAQKNLPENKLKEKEAELLLSAISSKAKLIVLDENGENPSSIKLAGLISKWQDDGVGEIAFLIGGAAGHGKQVLKKADYTLSFGKLTWPHMLIRPMLAEQIYRIYTIITGHPYHRS